MAVSVIAVIEDDAHVQEIIAALNQYNRRGMFVLYDVKRLND